LPLPVIEPRSPGRPVRCQDTILTELPRLPNLHIKRLLFSSDPNQKLECVDKFCQTPPTADFMKTHLTVLSCYVGTDGQTNIGKQTGLFFQSRRRR
jgi:hypothetical protein